MKTAFVLLRTLGDIVLLNTLVNEYKKIHPEDIISVYVNDSYYEIVACNPRISEVIAPPNWDLVLREISDGRYDNVFVPYETTPEDWIWHQVDKYRHQHLIDYYADRCGFKITERKCYMYPTVADIEAVDKLDIPENSIAIHTTTLVPSKNWDKFPELITELKEKGYNVIQVGSNEDILLDAQDMRDIGINATAVLISKCKYFIGLDSGLSYIADAMETKTICLMGATIPTTSGPIGKNVVHILSDTRPECEIRCHGNCRFGEENKCINNITVAQVMEEVDVL